MSHENIIRAWKDAEYRMSLSEEERAQLPENPAGLIELIDAQMSMVGGGYCCEGDGYGADSGSPTCVGTSDGQGGMCT